MEEERQRKTLAQKWRHRCAEGDKERHYETKGAIRKARKRNKDKGGAKWRIGLA